MGKKKVDDHAHEHVGELLDRYRTGELGESERLRVEGHLEACADCRAELKALKAFARVVERGFAAEHAARAAEREPDWARLRASIVGRTSARATGARRSRLARYVPQAALAVLALVALGVLWEQGIRSPGEAERALRSERPAERRADGAAEGSDGPVAAPEAEREERPTDEDRFAAAQQVDLEARANAVSQAVSGEAANERGREVGLDERGLRERVGVVEGDVDRAAADAADGWLPKEAPDAEGVEEAVAPPEPAEDRVAAKAVSDAARQAAEPPIREELGKAAAPPPEIERFRRDARSALAQADTLLAARALSQWRDSLAPRQDLAPELERAARALADSLSAFLATRP